MPILNLKTVRKFISESFYKLERVKGDERNCGLYLHRKKTDGNFLSEYNLAKETFGKFLGVSYSKTYTAV